MTTTGAAARRKGQRFQRHVAALLEADGWHVQNIGSGVSGTDLIATGNGTQLYIETKHQERLKVPEWWQQTQDSTPAGAVPVLVMRVGRRVLWVTSEPATVTDTDRIRAQRYSVYDESGDQYDATDEVHALVARLEAAEAVARIADETTWNGYAWIGLNPCVRCGGEQPRHDPGCELASALSAWERSQETGQP